MIYWRLLILAIVVAMVCLLNLPAQVSQIEYALSHSRTNVLQEEFLVATKELAKTNKVSDPSKYVERLENLGWIYFELSKVTDAEATFTRELDFCEAHKLKDYDATYVHSLLNIATFYRERANFERANFYYDKVRNFDLLYCRIPDTRRARDMANLGFLYYLRAESVQEKDKRADFLCRAESFCKSALNEYQLLPDTQRSQGDVLATDAVVLRDLGLFDEAAESAKKSREILAEANNKATEP